MRVLDLDTRIAPFGDRVADLACLDTTFDGFRLREVEQSRVDPTRIVMVDSAFVSAPLLAAWAARTKGPSALAVSADSVLQNYVPVSSVRRVGDLFVFDIFIDTEGDDLDTLRRNATPVEVALEGRTRRRELPRLGGAHHLDLIDDGVLAMHVEHWVHVLWLWPALVRRLGRGRRRNVIGKNTSIHPSAVVEGSVIGDDVEIGASSSVRHSFIGRGCRLSDFTKVAYSVLGDGTHTLADATFSEMVALGDGTLTNLLFKDSILGRQVFLTTGVTFWTDQLEGNVTVRQGDEEIDSGRPVLGGCAGHGAVLGARTILAPGRALPNRTTVVMRKEEGVFRIQDAPPGTPMCWDQAAMVPVASVAPDYHPGELDDDARQPFADPKRSV